jgi:hypothetical protein
MLKFAREQELESEIERLKLVTKLKEMTFNLNTIYIIQKKLLVKNKNFLFVYEFLMVTMGLY